MKIESAAHRPEFVWFGTDAPQSGCLKMIIDGRITFRTDVAVGERDFPNPRVWLNTMRHAIRKMEIALDSFEKGTVHAPPTIGKGTDLAKLHVDGEDGKAEGPVTGPGPSVPAS